MDVRCRLRQADFSLPPQADVENFDWREVMVREEYKETGGLRWGLGFWTGVNVSWPFAHLVASSERVQIRMSFLGIWSRVFNFSRHEIKSIKRKHGLWSVGIVIEHTKMDYPPFILFWTFNYRSFKEAMAKLGYDIIDDG